MGEYNRGTGSAGGSMGVTGWWGRRKLLHSAGLKAEGLSWGRIL